MPCNVDEINITEPDGPKLPGIPGFGNPFTPKLPDISFPEGFPEDLNEIFKYLSMLLPPGILKPSLSLTFSKNPFDAILSLLDKFVPFLMLYKFFLPLLNIIICIIEVLCAISNPFKLIRALKRLFRQCIPQFLSLFPIFALILMLISLLLLLLALIEYIIAQILRLINLILKNINALIKATQNGDENSLIAITKKLGMLLCSFQNIFVILAIFGVIIEVIKDMLKLLFSIPPCDDTDPNDTDNCCTPDVCPSFIRNNEEFERVTGSLQYYSAVNYAQGQFVTSSIRNQSYQFFDIPSPQNLQIINITDAFDITNVSPKPVFFPTEVTYSSTTPINQAPYKVTLKLFYNPSNWGRNGSQYGNPRFIVFENCIVLSAPTRDLKNYANNTSNISSGVVTLAGGRGKEINGDVLLGFAADGTTQTTVPATLENFLFVKPTNSENPQLVDDGYKFENVEYIFKINHEVLLGKALITLGCIPTISLDRTFVNSVFGGNSGVNFTLLNNLINGVPDPQAPGGLVPGSGGPGNGFPDITAAQTCLQNALDALRLDMSQDGVANFQSTAQVCLDKLKNDTNSAIGTLIGIGYDQYKSTFTIDPDVQFTSRKIKIKVQLNELNGTSITDNLPASVSSGMELRFKANLDFGIIEPFKYDGSKYFESNIYSEVTGNGKISISFDDKAISTVTLPTDLNVSPSVVVKELPYSFIFTPVVQIGDNTVLTGAGDTDGAPRRGPEDLSGGGQNSPERG